MKEKTYQERMTGKYGSAEKLYTERKIKCLRKEDIYVTQDNVIKVKESTPVYWRKRISEEKKEIEVEGEIYNRIVKESYVKDVYEFVIQDTSRYWELKDYTFKFELLNLQYEFCEYLGLSFNYRHSEDEYVNTVINLFELGVLDKKITSVWGGKYNDWGYQYKDRFISELKENNINNIELTIVILDYGWENKLQYNISLDTFFKAKPENIQKHARYYFQIFKELGLNLKNTTYEKRLLWLNKYQNKSKCYILKDDNTGLYKIEHWF